MYPPSSSVGLKENSDDESPESFTRRIRGPSFMNPPSSFCEENPRRLVPRLVFGSETVFSAIRPGITFLGAQRMPPGFGAEQLIARIIRQTQAGGEEQRGTVFHARGSVNLKPCIVVIDSGSYNNLVSESFVTRLGKPLMNHPQEYDLGGIYGNQARITKQAFLPFAVGDDYADCMPFDVVKTSHIQLLLGRRWQIVNRVVHDGCTNKYFIMRGEILITLCPSEIEPAELMKEIEEAEVGRKRKKSSLLV